jgi:anti-anti-sigma regulatory factor
MLRIQKSYVNGELIFALSGRIDEEEVAELETVIRSEASGRRMVLDLKDVTLADQGAISLLGRCEADGIALLNCPMYVRELITRQRRES